MGRKQIKKTGAAAKKHWKISEKIILIVAILLLLLGAIAIAGRTLMSTRFLGPAASSAPIFKRPRNCRAGC